MRESFRILLDKYMKDALEPGELQLFLKMARKKEFRKMLEQALDKELDSSDVSYHSIDEDPSGLFDMAMYKAQEISRSRTSVVRIRSAIYRISSAAAIILVITAVVLYFTRQKEDNRGSAGRVSIAQNEKAIPPGGDRAVLLLADGREIDLNELEEGTLAEQAGVNVIKLPNGQVVYQPATVGGSAAVFNTMKTPRGGQYQLLLADGTQVWLNSSSSVRFPVAFTGDSRQVELEGEAYFKVATDRKKPFRVMMNGMKIEVLGTSFNVNGYKDEDAIRTTLIEGAVKISKGTADALLKPGQQAQVTSDGSLRLVNTEDIDKVLAWKNGLFSFRNEDIRSIMRQLSRWYDFEVHYQGKISERKFTGQVFRNLSLQEALKVLELNDVHFKIENKKITVLP